MPTAHCYWSLGRDIADKQYANTYGTGFYKTLSHDLRSEMPGEKGFSETNLKYTYYFYQLYYQLVENHLQGVDDLLKEICSIPWFHQQRIIDKCKGDAKKALFFALGGQYVRAQRDLWGEKISWGEDISIIDLSYNWKSWEFSAGVIMPFGKYDQGSKSLSKWNRNEQHMHLDMRMPYISISYNVQWGRQKRGAQKLVDVNADADRSTAGGR